MATTKTATVKHVANPTPPKSEHGGAHDVGCLVQIDRYPAGDLAGRVGGVGQSHHIDWLKLRLNDATQVIER